MGVNQEAFLEEGDRGIPKRPLEDFEEAMTTTEPILAFVLAESLVEYKGGAPTGNESTQNLALLALKGVLGTIMVVVMKKVRKDDEIESLSCVLQILSPRKVRSSSLSVRQYSIPSCVVAALPYFTAPKTSLKR
jgi:hypothetical protein